MNTLVKYWHSQGKRKTADGRTYYDAEMVGKHSKDKDGRWIYIIRPEHSEFERLVTEDQFE